LRDREQQHEKQNDAAVGEAIACFQCSKPFNYRGPRGGNSGRFCSDQCRVEYDVPGAFTFDPFRVKRWHVIAGGDLGYLASTPMTPVKRKDQPGGWRVACRGCGKTFEARGWAYCSAMCKRLSAERTEAREAMAEGGMDGPVKRRCECPCCENTVPNWRKGRRVSSKTRFCSPRCARAAKTLAGHTLRPTSLLVAETSKKSLQNRPSEEANTP